MSTTRIVVDLDDNDYTTLARARGLVKRLFGLGRMPSNRQVVSWMLRSIPWSEVESLDQVAPDMRRVDQHETSLPDVQ